MSIIEYLYIAAAMYSFCLIVSAYKHLHTSDMSETSFMFFSIFISNVGCWLQMSSNNLQEALIASKISYIGGCLLLFFFLLAEIKICRLTIQKISQYLVMTATLLVMCLTLTIGRSNIFYSSTVLSRHNGYSSLSITYGPFFKCYIIFLAMYMVTILVVAVYAVSKPKISSALYSVLMLFIGISTIVAYLSERIFDIGYELMPFWYCILGTLILVVLKRYRKYDVSRVAQYATDYYNDRGYVVFSKKLRFIGCDDAARKLFSEVNSLNVDRAVSPTDDDQKFFYELLMEFSFHSEVPLEKIVARGDKFLKITVKDLFSEKEKDIPAILIEIADYTSDRKQLETIKAMNSELEAATEAANSANLAKSNFLANMSHEIRTPINAVLGMNSIILRDCEDEKILEYARDIQNAGNNLLSLVNDILDFSKIESGKMNLVPIEYDLASLVNDCVSMIFMKMSDKNLEFHVTNNPDIPGRLFGDELRIRQIVINLLTNAVKYTDSGSITFEIDYLPLDEKQIKLILRVKDTGKGISRENQDKLFHSFQRVDEVVNRNIEGTGLGLALVKRFATLMNGDVSVESEVGVGSTFTVEIPQTVTVSTPVGVLKKTTMTEVDKPKMADLSETEATILVVDDVAMNLKVFTHLLKKSKLKIDTCDSGIKALNRLSEKKYDIVFLDYLMPVMDGLETFRKLRSIPDSPNADTPVVMLTANAMEGAREEYLNEGFAAYLAKPVTFDPLKDVILELLNK